MALSDLWEFLNQLLYTHLNVCSEVQIFILIDFYFEILSTENNLNNHRNFPFSFTEKFDKMTVCSRWCSVFG